MEENEALSFYQRITEGKKQYQEISLEHRTGDVLEGVRMHPVDKRTLAEVIEQLPDEMFDSIDEAETPEEAEEQLEEEGGSLNAVTGGTVDAFEEICKQSLTHPQLTNSQVNKIIDELDFGTLFELGTEVINISSEKTGAVRGFQKQG